MGVEAIAPTLALVQAGSGAYAASERNSSISRAIGSTQDAAEVQLRQIGQQVALEKQKSLNESRAIMGRLRAAGLGSTRALLNQAAFDSSINQRIIGMNYEAAVARVRSELSANIDQLGSGYSSPILAAFSGGTRGYMQGLSIEQALQPGPAYPATYGAGGSMAGPPAGSGTPPFLPY